MCCNMGTRYFYDVAKTVATRMEKTTKAERVVTEILKRVLGEQSVPVPRIEVDTETPATSEIPRHNERRGKQTQNLLP